MESLDYEQPTAKIHAVNCVSSMTFCSKCVSKCDLTSLNAISTTKNFKCFCRESEHGEKRMNTWINGVGGCNDALNDFLQWLFDGLPGGRKREVVTYVFGHYSGKYEIDL